MRRLSEPYWQIEDRAADAGVDREDGSHQGTVAAADIDDVWKPGEIVGGNQQLGNLSRVFGHGRVEDDGLIRIRGQIFEAANSENTTCPGFSGCHTVKQLSPGSPGAIAAEHQRHVSHRAGYVRAERVPRFRQGKPAEFELFDQPQARQRPQQAAKRHYGRVGFLRERVGRLCPTREQIGNAKMRRDMDHARRHVAARKRPQIGRRNGIRIAF